MNKKQSFKEYSKSALWLLLEAVLALHYMKRLRLNVSPPKANVFLIQFTENKQIIIQTTMKKV
jgi:hypothetical protein